MRRAAIMPEPERVGWGGERPAHLTQRNRIERAPTVFARTQRMPSRGDAGPMRHVG